MPDFVTFSRSMHIMRWEKHKNGWLDAPCGKMVLMLVAQIRVTKAEIAKTEYPKPRKTAGGNVTNTRVIANRMPGP